MRRNALKWILALALVAGSAASCSGNPETDEQGHGAAADTSGETVDESAEDADIETDRGADLGVDSGADAAEENDVDVSTEVDAAMDVGVEPDSDVDIGTETGVGADLDADVDWCGDGATLADGDATDDAVSPSDVDADDDETIPDGDAYVDSGDHADAGAFDGSDTYADVDGSPDADAADDAAEDPDARSDADQDAAFDIDGFRDADWETDTGTEEICPVGYAWNGVACADVDECAEESDECHSDSDCVNLCGGYECDCPDGYLGDYCEPMYCFGVLVTEPDVCAGHGSCVGPDDCECDPGWGTVVPSEPCAVELTCDVAGDEACGGFEQGFCMDDGDLDNVGVCTCISPYFGEFCFDVLTCPDRDGNDVEAYEGSGACCGLGTCYAGPESHITGEGLCDCFDGVAGSYCSDDRRKCNGVHFDQTSGPSGTVLVCEGRGVCAWDPASGNYTCTCDPGYDTVICMPAICDAGATGEICSGLGTCVKHGLCDCELGFAPMAGDCVELTCFDLFASAPTVCSGSGDCVDWDSCGCREGFVGDECERVEICPPE